MSRTKHASANEEYSIRPYQPGDGDRFLSLYETVWGTSKDREWFDWRFTENPNGNEVEMVVAEAGGRLVGAEPLVPYSIRAGDRVLEARQPVDWIVHPEYRRQGIFSAMTERLLESVEGTATLLFNFPNEQLRPGIERFGWRAIDTVGARYRVQNAGAVAAMGKSSRPRSASATIATAGSPIVRGGLRVLDRFGSTTRETTVDCVQRVDGVPVDVVHERYAENVPQQLHVPRDHAFLEWRFDNPRWKTETYLAHQDDEVVTSVVAATESVEGSRLLRLLDVQPMSGDLGGADAFEAILATILDDHTDADVIKAPTELYPSVCRRHGFVRDDVFPLSRVSSTTHHAIRPLDRGTAENGSSEATVRIDDESRSYDITDPAEWLLALGDLDVA